MMSINLSDIVLLSIKSSDYHCIISLISKNEAINLNIIKISKEILTFCNIEIEKKIILPLKDSYFWEM